MEGNGRGSFGGKFCDEESFFILFNDEVGYFVWVGLIGKGITWVEVEGGNIILDRVRDVMEGNMEVFCDFGKAIFEKEIIVVL